jgi:hypothetical protein
MLLFLRLRPSQLLPSYWEHRCGQTASTSTQRMVAQRAITNMNRFTHVLKSTALLLNARVQLALLVSRTVSYQKMAKASE